MYETDQYSDTAVPSETITRKNRKRRSKETSRAPSLRPHTLMIDLLFGALMLFAFQMGDPNSRNIIPIDFDLPTANEKASKKDQNLLPLKPVRVGKDHWIYEMPDGSRVDAKTVFKTLKEQNKTPVLLVQSTARVQSYIDAEQPLRRLGIKAGLAVSVNDGGSK